MFLLQLIKTATLRIFNTPLFQHSAFSTLRIFNTPHFQHSAFSILRTPGLQHSTYPCKPDRRDVHQLSVHPLCSVQNTPNHSRFNYLLFTLRQRTTTPALTISVILM